MKPMAKAFLTSPSEILSVNAQKMSSTSASGQVDDGDLLTLGAAALNVAKAVEQLREDSLEVVSLTFGQRPSEGVLDLFSSATAASRQTLRARTTVAALRNGHA